MPRVSVFVDGENISSVHALAILDAAQGLGEVDYLRVYGDAGLVQGWEDVPGYRLIHSGRGKNAADLLLTVDAMERAFSGQCDGVVIASSDGDFRHLAERLRERGLSVLGMGQEKAGLRFKASCTRFKALRPPTSQRAAVAVADPSVAALVSEVPQTPPKPAGKVGKLSQKVVAAINDHGCPETGIDLATLNRVLLKEHRVAIGSYPEKTWRGYLQARANLFDVDPKGPNAKVRLRRVGPALAAE